MVEEKSKSSRMVSFEDLLLSALFSWITKKVLDALWERGKARIKGESHFRQYFLKGVTMAYVEFFVETMIIGASKFAGSTNRKYQDSLKRALLLHKHYHKVVGTDSCSSCDRIIRFRQLFMKSVSDPNLYPPLN